MAHNHIHLSGTKSLNTVFVVSIVLNFLFVAIEAGVGLWQNSLGLISDAGHNLSDVFGLILALVAFRLSKVHSNKRFTYGYKKSTILISLLNAIILLVAVGAIIVESIHKFTAPVPVNGSVVSWTAGVGIVVNGITALLLMRNQKEDLNIRGAFLHMAADTLVSVGVLISGIIISYTGMNIIDPIIGLVIAVVILVSTWHLLSESLRLALDAMPRNMDYDSIVALIRGIAGVIDVHHIHIWAISTTETALTAHVVISDINLLEKIKGDIKRMLREKGIAHATIEIEYYLQDCACQKCY